MTDAGTYLILFEASVTQAGQLILAVNGTETASTAVGRSGGGGQIVGMTIQALPAGATLQVRNPTGNVTPLTLTPTAGGNAPVNAHLIVVQLSAEAAAN